MRSVSGPRNALPLPARPARNWSRFACAIPAPVFHRRSQSAFSILFSQQKRSGQALAWASPLPTASFRSTRAQFRLRIMMVRERSSSSGFRERMKYWKRRSRMDEARILIVDDDKAHMKALQKEINMSMKRKNVENTD